MAKSKAYIDFLDQYKELRSLLRHGLALPNNKTVIRVQALIAKSIVVLLAGHVEMYINGVTREVLDGIDSEWNSLRHCQKKCIVSGVCDELSVLNDSTSEVREDVDGVKDLIIRVHSWFQQPKAFSSEFQKFAIYEFYRNKGPKSIDTHVRRLRSDNKSFFEWVAAHAGSKIDRSRLFTVLEDLISTRTDYAHGRMATSKTLVDATLYMKTAVILACLIEQCLHQEYPYLSQN